MMFLLLFCLLLILVKPLRRPLPFYTLLLSFVVAATCISTNERLPIIVVVEYITKSINRVSFKFTTI